MIPRFHLTDFVDMRHHHMADQVPQQGDGVYVPQAFWEPLEKKVNMFRMAIETIAADYQFCTLAQWAQQITTESKQS
jgi:hypothetical protein